MSKAVTLVDVARQASVGVSTASKALSGAPHVRRETRDKVIAAAEFLGYSPNGPARALKSGRTYMVGLITSDAEGRFTVPVILGAERSLASGRMAILFCDARDDPVRELHWIETLKARSVDGFIVTSHRSDPRASLTHLVDTPVVYAYSPSQLDTDVSVVPDDWQGGYLAGEHLVETGRSRIAYIGGPVAYEATCLRRDGAIDALAKFGLTLATDPLYVPWEEKAGRRAARTLLARGIEVDGLFCASDQIARGVSEELQSHGVAVPRDVAIVGFDDWQQMTLATEPELTTIKMNLETVGEVAANRLLEQLGGSPVSAGRERVPCELVVRASSG